MGRWTRPAALPLTLTCSCGCQGSLALSGPDREVPTWSCPGCAVVWQVEATGGEQYVRLAAGLSRLRREAVVVPVAAAVVALALAALHPAWLLLVPLVIGGAVTVYRPRYRKRLTRLYAQLPQPRVIRRVPRAGTVSARGLVPGARLTGSDPR